MVKLKTAIFNKLMAQAEEAHERGLVKLAEDIKQAIGTEPIEEPIEYSYIQLHDDVRQDLWKLATRLMVYYDLESVDADKLQYTILNATAQIVNDLEESLSVDEIVIGPLEPSVLGEIK